MSATRVAPVPAASSNSTRCGPDVGRDRGFSLSQRLYGGIGFLGTPLVKVLSHVIGRRPKPVTSTLPTKRVGDTAYSTPSPALEEALASLAASAPAWAATPFERRAALARQCAQLSVGVAEAMAADAVAYKGSYEVGDGEEFVVWAATPAVLNDLAHSLDALGAKRPRCPTAVRWRAAPGGEQQAVAQVFPDPLFEHLLFHGYQGELWLQPGAAPSFGAEAVLGGPGEVCLVLGAGNQAVVAVADVALKVLVHGAATILKMNPVNEWAGPHIEASLKPLIDAGALRVVYGGPEVGRTLTAHPAVQSVHITGSDKTYDAIVWAGQPKRADVAPPYTKPVSAELGCITPYTLVPGEWSEADLEAKAGEVVAAVAHNNSCNCLAAKVLLLGRNWAQKDAFLAVLRRRFAASARRAAFYPGSTEKYDAFAAAFPDAEQLGAACDAAPGAGLRTLPTLLLPPAPPSVGDKALIDEAWSPVLALRELDTPAGDVPAFLRAAADTLNNQVWGTLSCSVFIHPATERAHAAAFDTFLGELRYGSIGVNVPTILSYFTPAMSWGGFPGAHTAADIGSGTGQIHNTRLMDAVQKSVLRAPWSPAVTPFWSPDHGDMPKLARAIVDYMATPSVVNLVRVIVHAAKG